MSAQSSAAIIERMRIADAERDARRYRYIKRHLETHHVGELRDPGCYLFAGFRLPYLANLIHPDLLDPVLDRMIELEDQEK